jgi:hypothetical protein
VDTRYRWHYGGNAFYRPASSPTTSIVIREPVQATSLVMEVDENRLFIGQRAVVSGTLTTGGTPRVNRSIELSVSTDGGATWTVLTSRQTNVEGQASVTVRPTSASRYRWRFAGAGPLQPSSSNVVKVAVYPLEATSLTNVVAQSTIDAGKRAELWTLFRVKGDPAPGTEVVLQRSPAGTIRWTTVASVTTGAGGLASARVPQDTNMEYRWLYLGSESRSRATSPVRLVKARFVVTLSVISAPPHAGDRILVDGTVSRHTGAPVKLMRQTASGPVPLASATVRTDGTYQIAVTLSTAGSYKLYAEVGPDTRNVAGKSALEVVQVPN